MPGANSPYTKLSQSQVLQQSFDEVNDLLRVGIVGATLDPIQVGGLSVQIDHTEDSIRLGNGTDYLTSTTNGLKIGLDVNIINDTLAVTQSGTWNINNVSGTISLPTGASTSALQTSGNLFLSSIDSKIPSNLTVTSNRLLVNSSGVANDGVDIGDVTVNNASGASAVNIQDGGNSITTDSLAEGTVSPGTAGTRYILVGGVYNTTPPTLTNGQQVSLQVNNRGNLMTEDHHATASTVTSVAGSSTNVTLLAANPDRQSVLIFNDSNATLYIKLGTTASSTDYTVKLSKDQLFEIHHPGYIGRIDGIWSSATGSAKITELT